jgi:hypothetical protein
MLYAHQLMQKINGNVHYSPADDMTMFQNMRLPVRTSTKVMLIYPPANEMPLWQNMRLQIIPSTMIMFITHQLMK